MTEKQNKQAVKKILTFLRLEDSPFGGAENYLRRVKEELQSRGIDTNTLHSQAPHWLASWIKALWFNIEARYKKQSDQFYFSLARIDSADIYRAGDGVHRVFMRAVGKHFWHNPLHVVTCYLEKRCFQNAKKIIANSMFVQKQIIETYRVPAEKIEVVYNGVNLPTENLDKQDQLRSEFNIATEKKIILFVGNDFKRKGGDIFIDIVRKISVNYHAVMVGKDKHIENYRQWVDAAGLSAHITLTGQRHDIARFYQAADILLFTPRYEPFSNVVLESMAHHCVAITSDQNGASEILPPDCVLHADNKADIIRLITSLLSDNEKLKAYQTQCFEIAKAYSIARSVDNTLKVINSVM